MSPTYFIQVCEADNLGYLLLYYPYPTTRHYQKIASNQREEYSGIFRPIPHTGGISALVPKELQILSNYLKFTPIQAANIVLQGSRSGSCNMLTKGAGGHVLTQSETLRKVVIIMSTYEEFMVILTVGLLIVAILNLKNKK